MSQQAQPELPYRDIHHEILKKAIPHWLGNASPHKRNALAATTPEVPDWYRTAAEQQHQTLKRLNAEAWLAQNQMDKSLANLKSPEEFGAKLVQQALKKGYDIEHNVRTTYLQLDIPLTMVGFKVEPGASRTWTVSLLDAALHNFEASETQAQAYGPYSGFITQPTTTGRFESLPSVNAKITVTQFTSLCRDLDIGARYERYLEDYLGLGNSVAQAALEQKSKQSQIAALNLALYMALLKEDIPAASHDAVKHLINDNHSTGLLSYELIIMSSRLTGIVLFANDLDRSREVVPVVAYIPDDPQHPIKHYASTADFVFDLTDKLRSPDYQRFFSRFVSHADLGNFFADLNSRLVQVTWHSHRQGDPLPSWRETPGERPNLQLRSRRTGHNLFSYLYQMKLSKLINDARSQVVSTAKADQNARWARWAVIQKVGSALLQVVALIATPFFPPLGALILGYTAYQLLDEAFEGVIDWAEGLKQEAFGHAMSFIEQMIQVGLFAVGLPIASDILRKVLPTDLLQFIDRFKPITRPSGKARLWKPDLIAYEQATTLSNDARPNDLGLHWHDGKAVLRVNGKTYHIEQDSASGRYHLRHPTRSDAYRPSVRTNGEGAWVTELENPLEWDSNTLMRRLGYQTEDLSEAQLQQVRAVSNTHDNMLRHLHINQQTAPPLLADSLKRFKIDQALQDFILQMSSDDPALYGKADPQTQLYLLTNHGVWPRTKTLRFLDASGKTAWEFAGHEGASVVQIHEAQLDNGELLRTVVECLDESERKILLEEEFGEPPASTQTRATTLRKKLAQIADKKRFSLFDSRYRTLEHAGDPRLQKIIDSAPQAGLPTSVARELLANASGQELREVDLGKVPKRIADLAEWTQHEVRTTRAYEGLYLDALENPDTHVLALHSLENLPGWRTNIRLEVRHYRAEGALLDAIGPEDAPLKRILILGENGKYTPAQNNDPLFGETDFYTATLQAIPDAQRNALNIHVAQDGRLKQAIVEVALDRQQLRTLLDADPQVKPPYDPKVMRLRGGMEGYRAASTSQPGHSSGISLEERAHHLLPSLTTEEVRELVHTLQSRPTGALATLISLQNEFDKMDTDLSVWEISTPRFHPESEAPLNTQQYDYARRNRAAWANELRRAWRYETELDDFHESPNINGLMLRLPQPIFGELPRLTARFEHISFLELVGGNAELEANTFLQRFPKLRHLEIRNYSLDAFPAAISSMPQLNTLVLSECNITLNDETQAAISILTGLLRLDLFRNPLRLTPNIASMRGLQYLDLSHTGITQLPIGLLSRSHLTLALLSSNQISELPAALFNLPAEASDNFDLSDNPLSPAALEQVKTYFQRTGRHWEADAAPADIVQAKQLYPSLSSNEINRFIFRLPGNLETGRATMDQLQVDYQNLRTDMTPWVNDIHVSPIERTLRAWFIHDLETAWRLEISTDDHIQGPTPSYQLTLASPVNATLPSLRTRFDHVSSLTLRGNGGSLQLGNFLQSFPALNRLAIKQYDLGDFPSSIANLPRLTHLSLDRCAIQLSSSNVTSLNSMARLKYLNLSNNPLGLLPDVRHLRSLTSLSLSNTGLTEVPLMLISPDPIARTRVDLSHNAIEHIPDEVFTLPATVTAAFEFSHNPLSRQTLEQIKTYCQATNEYLMADAPANELQRIKALYPQQPETELSRIFFQLPGNLDAADSAISQLAIEFEQMRTDLQAWVLDVPQREPLLDTVLDEGERAEEQIRRLHFKELLERCWLRETEPDTSGTAPRHTYSLVFQGQLLGDLPQLSARFNHVTALELIGEGTNQGVDGLLRSCPNLRDLLVERHALDSVPEPIFSLTQLRHLKLLDNQIRLAPDTMEELSRLTYLEYLDVSDNPLSTTPDVRNLTGLSALYMHNCGLTQTPHGVFGLPRLQRLDLSDNEISILPSDILEMALPLGDESDLSGNPLTDESLDLLRRYYQQTGYELGVEEAMAAPQGSPLTPPGTPEPMEE